MAAPLGEVSGGGPPRPGRAHGRAAVGLWLTLPPLLVLCLTVIYPVAWTLWLSLNGPETALSGTPDFRSLDNYLRIGGSRDFRAALGNTLGLTLASFVLEALPLSPRWSASATARPSSASRTKLATVSPRVLPSAARKSREPPMRR